MAYLEELDALQRFIYGTAGLQSTRLTHSPPHLARPIASFEAPFIGRDRHLNRYSYVKRVQQYGRLYVSSLEEFASLQDKLFETLEDQLGILPVFNEDGQEVGKLKEVTLEFNRSDNLDIPFTFTYEATYGRVRPAPAPPASAVYNKVTTKHCT